MKKTVELLVFLMFAIISIPCMAANAVSVWDGEGVNTNWAENYDAASVFSIDSADDFIAFRNMVMDEKDFSGKTVKLNTDIDLDNHNLKYGVGGFTTTGRTSGNTGQWYHSLTMFRGVFDGNGHVIKNIKMNQNEDDSVLDSAVYGDNTMIGLFYNRGASIKNLGIENIKITFSDSGTSKISFAGGLCSVNFETSVNNCFVKNAEFDGGNAVTTRVRLGVISGYHRAATVENCYVDGADFSGITIGQTQGALQAGGLVYAEQAGVTSVKRCYTANVDKGNARMEKFHECVLNNNDSDASLENVFSEGHTENSSGSTGLLILGDSEIGLALGAGYIDLSGRMRYPILAWENVPDMFECDDIAIYRDYQTAGETRIDNLMTNNGELTVVLKGFKNNTGKDLDNAVVNVSCISGGMLKSSKSVFTSIEKMKKNEDDENIVIPFDLSGVEIGSGDFIQVIVYKGAETVVPVLRVKRVTK